MGLVADALKQGIFGYADDDIFMYNKVIARNYPNKHSAYIIGE